MLAREHFIKHCTEHMVGHLTSLSLVVRKPVFGVSHHGLHNPGGTAIEDGWRLEILDLVRRGIVLSM